MPSDSQAAPVVAAAPPEGALAAALPSYYHAITQLLDLELDNSADQLILLGLDN